MRITQNTISRQVLSNLQRNFQSVATLQNVLSTGRKFQVPGDSPLAYVESLNLRQEIQENRRYQRNIDLGGTNLALTETTLGNVNNRLQRARQLALQAANEALPQDARENIADEIEQILQSVVEQANSNFEGRFLFGGDQTLRAPFERVVGPDGTEGVLYRGDFGDRLVEINQGEYIPINLTGPGAFFTRLNETSSLPAVDPAALLAPQLSTSVPPLSAGAGSFTVDGVTINFDPAVDTLESIRDSINREVRTAEARIDASGRLTIRSLTSNDVALEDGSSNLLGALGMHRRVEGGAIGAGVTGATTLASLGITGDALRVLVGEQAYDIDLAGAVTVSDVIGAVGSSGAPVRVDVNAAGTGLVFSATRSAESLEVQSVRKIFSNSALAPGSVDLDTTFVSLGITPGVISINNDGAVTQVDLSSVTTVGGAIERINSEVNGVRASLSPDGTGLDLESSFLSSTLSVSDVGASTFATTLGIAQTRSEDNAADFEAIQPGTLSGTTGSNIFRSLGELITALRDPASTQDDFDEIFDDLSTDIETIQSNRSVVGAWVNRVESAQERFQAFEVFLTELLSKNEDADLADTITQLTTQSNVLEASLSAGARILQPSLLDFLR